MKVTLPDGRKVFVSWKYEKIEDKLVHGNKTKYVEKEQTTCLIIDENKQLIKQASIKRYHTDKSDKEVARKQTLRNILSDVSRDIRTLYWEAYKNRNSKK